jgi:hypothetical protein
MIGLFWLQIAGATSGDTLLRLKVAHAAARAVGDRDLDSFGLRLDPFADTDRLEPGMTVWLPRRS